MFWRDFNQDLLQKIKLELINQETTIISKFEGRDYHFGSISASRTNVRQMNFSEHIELKRFNFLKQKTKHPPRHIIFNPPYGQRLEILDSNFYQKMGNVLKNFYSGSVVSIITSDIENIKLIGLKPSKKVQLFNGSLESHFLQYDLYDNKKNNKK